MYPIRITVRLDEHQSGYAYRIYHLFAQSGYVKDRFGHRAIGRAVLRAVEASHAQFLVQGA